MCIQLSLIILTRKPNLNPLNNGGEFKGTEVDIEEGKYFKHDFCLLMFCFFICFQRHKLDNTLYEFIILRSIAKIRCSGCDLARNLIE